MHVCPTPHINALSFVPCRQQQVDDFLDEDERDAAAKAAVAVAPEFDTFGAASTLRAREAAEAEAGERHREAIPGLLPAELLTPVADSIGEWRMA